MRKILLTLLAGLTLAGGSWAVVGLYRAGLLRVIQVDRGFCAGQWLEVGKPGGLLFCHVVEQQAVDRDNQGVPCRYGPGREYVGCFFNSGSPTVAGCNLAISHEPDGDIVFQYPWWNRDRIRQTVIHRPSGETVICLLLSVFGVWVIWWSLRR